MKDSLTTFLMELAEQIQISTARMAQKFLPKTRSYDKLNTKNVSFTFLLSLSGFLLLFKL